MDAQARPSVPFKRRCDMNAIEMLIAGSIPLWGKRVLFSFLLMVLFTAGAAAQPQTAETVPADANTKGFVDALKNGELSLNLRYRFEYVTDGTTASTGKDARASTLRTSLSYKPRPFHGFGGFIEMENISVPGKNTFNNKGDGHLANGVTDRPVVADVKLTELNQVYFELTAIPNTAIQAGRKEVILDNHRFLGNVGWRQNHQSFDTVSVVNRTIPRTTITYAHLFKVHTIFGDSRPMHSNLLNASIHISDSARLVSYAYLLDYGNTPDFGLSSNTFGFRLSGAQEVQGNWGVLYGAEYAKQCDGGDNPNGIDADYYLLEGGVDLGGKATFKAGYEGLGGGPEEGQFKTPLATLHAFNGWADKFLSTPANGIRDAYVSMGGSYGKFGLESVLHWFNSDTGDIGYGNEIDLHFTYRSPWKQTFALKTAFYRADGFSEDTDKVMIYTTYGF